MEETKLEVYAFGRSQFGQLGVGYTTQAEYQVPQRIALRVRLTKITLGAGHAVALSHQGKVYTWGLNLLGQLGVGDTEPRWSPTLVPTLKDAKIVDVASGAGHSFAVDKQSTVYSWGASADFQTGVAVRRSGAAGENTKQFLTTPRLVDGLNRKR